jgi:hypothetical protein
MPHPGQLGDLPPPAGGMRLISTCDAVPVVVVSVLVNRPRGRSRLAGGDRLSCRRGSRN